MRTNRLAPFAAAAAVIVWTACAAPAAMSAPKSAAESVVQAAARQKRYVFATFYKKNDSASTKMLAESKGLQGKYSSRANFVNVDVANSANRGLVTRFGVDRSPVPLMLVIAPNGAVTAGFPNAIKKTDLSEVFVSDGMAAVLKVIQGGKLAAVCLQNSATKHNKESLAAAEALNYQAQFRGAVVLVKIDPADRSESRLVKQFKADSTPTDAQIIVIAPPGKVVGKFDGAVTSDAITATLMKSLGGGCGGGSCGPGGCGG